MSVLEDSPVGRVENEVTEGVLCVSMSAMGETLEGCLSKRVEIGILRASASALEGFPAGRVENEVTEGIL
ncbi:MAG TPA: hypothetical protein VH593_15905 [Ktedonobacteraceae bacterium]|jgi:hypothetical protein